MKGLTHFMSGVALSTFLQAPVSMCWEERSFILVLGGLFGIMPDTLDFKVGQFFPEEDDAVVENGRMERLLHEWLNIASSGEAD